MPRILVVYYSRSGHTRQIAHEIAAALDADLEEISDPTPRSGFFGYLRSGREAWLRRRPPIADAARDPSRYDVVVVGTPIWNASLASPVRSYLYRYGYAIRSFAFFCTCGGFAIERVFRQMAVETGQAPVARLAVRERELANPARAALVARFAGEIRAAARAAARQSA
jgi:flavodoxin